MKYQGFSSNTLFYIITLKNEKNWCKVVNMCLNCCCEKILQILWYVPKISEIAIHPLKANRSITSD